MQTDGQRTMVWNYDNLPSSIIYGGTTTSFVYDGDGARVKKIGPAGTTLYIDKLYEVSGGSGAKYIFANDKRIALKQPTQTLYYHQDHLGSTSIVTNGSGTAVDCAFYKPFGGEVASSGIGVNHRFTGQELDRETDLYYYNARYYNPSLGRFVSVDTMVPHFDNPQSFNRYSYVLNFRTTLNGATT